MSRPSPDQAMEIKARLYRLKNTSSMNMTTVRLTNVRQQESPRIMQIARDTAAFKAAKAQCATSKTDPQFLIMPRMPQANIWRWKLASSADRPQKQSALSARLARAPLPHITCPPHSIDPLTPARAWLCRCSTRWRCCHHCNSGGCRCSY